jgi:NADH:ubiquinone oxidoreductase subunit F (NADH-binding)
MPGIEPRLMPPTAVAAPLELDTERALGVYEGVPRRGVIAELAEAGLRGRGGAAFPASVKWASVAAAEAPKVVVANGEEGEPTSGKDRWLLVHRPHLVLDGVLTAAMAVGAERAVLYLSHSETVAAVSAALAEARRAGLLPAGLECEVQIVAPTYVAGEETAACRAIDGGPALPLAKPPRPFEGGVAGRPTLVSNVETLAHASWISRHGAAAYRRYGTQASPGTTLVTLNGACGRPGVYEAPFGLSFDALINAVAGGATSEPAGFVMGGWFGGLLAPQRGELALCYDAVRTIGSGLGCAAITVLGADDDPLAVAAEVTAWYADESSQQCGVCMKGTAAIRDTLAGVRDHRATTTDGDRLARWGESLPGRGACAFLDGAATWARTVVREMPGHVAECIADGMHTMQNENRSRGD